MPGLIRGVARTAVVAGTASAVAGRVNRRQQQKWAAQDQPPVEAQYAELFEKYVQHVSVWVKKERIRNKITGEYEEPDAKMMKEVERLLDAGRMPCVLGGDHSVGDILNALALDAPR